MTRKQLGRNGNVALGWQVIDSPWATVFHAEQIQLTLRRPDGDRRQTVVPQQAFVWAQGSLTGIPTYFFRR